MQKQFRVIFSFNYVIYDHGHYIILETMTVYNVYNMHLSFVTAINLFIKNLIALCAHAI